jgi:23S rRNA (uracil1939-C5)-methyltransferase
MTEAIIELRIEKLVYGGDGLGHNEGNTVFVPFVLPEETVSVETIEQRKKFVRGRVASVVQPSPIRIAAPCPHFGVCGGCNYQHIPYKSQLQFKADILRETLSRLGRIAWEGPITTHASPAYGYRNRAQWKIGKAPASVTENAAADGDKPVIGYFESGSQKLCPVRECPILSPRLAETLAALSKLLQKGDLPDTLREVEAFADDADEKVLLNLSFERLDTPSEQIAQKVRAILPTAETLLLQNRRADKFELVGPGYLSYRVGDAVFQVGHLSFFQVNRFLIAELVSLVLGDAKGNLALDLFAGVGLFTVPLAHRFQRVVAVESNEASARDLAANLQQSGAGSPSARHTRVEPFLERWNDRPDMVLLDPPRAGVSPEALASLNKLAPAAIVYLSCDPATLARDLAILTGTTEKPGRYQISEVHLVDIFPETYHMEVLVRLSRRE